MTALTANLVLGRELPADMIFLGSGLEFAPKRKGKALGILARRCLQFLFNIYDIYIYICINIPTFSTCRVNRFPLQRTRQATPSPNDFTKAAIAT